MAHSPYVNLPIPKRVPQAFLFRRLHSLAGAFFILFLCEHMLTNSTSALLIREEGSGFIRAVNFLQSLPYLNYIEIFFLAVPIAIHLFLGIIYFCEARWNSFASDGSKPSLSKYIRNQAFTWQRITALIVVIGIISHVLTMRFLQHPQTVTTQDQTQFAVPVTADPGLITLAPRLHTTLITPTMKETLLQVFERRQTSLMRQTATAKETPLWAQTELIKDRLDKFQKFIAGLHPTDMAWTALAPDFGTALLLVVRENFRTPWICILYTMFILAASFHAANGLWTFSISWGVALNEFGRIVIRAFGVMLGLALLFGGLASIWLTYWVTLNT